MPRRSITSPGEGVPPQEAIDAPARTNDNDTEPINFRGKCRFLFTEEREDSFALLKREMATRQELFTEVDEIDLSALPEGALVHITGAHPSAVYLLQRAGDTIRIFHGLYGTPVVVAMSDINRSVKFREVESLSIERCLRKGNRIDAPYFKFQRTGSAPELPDQTWCDTIMKIKVWVPERR